MKLTATQIDFGHLPVRHIDAGSVGPGVRLRVHVQPRFGGGPGNQASQDASKS